MAKPDWAHIQSFTMFVAPVQINSGTTDNGVAWTTCKFIDFQSGEEFVASMDPKLWSAPPTMGTPGNYIFKIHFETVPAKVRKDWKSDPNNLANWKDSNVKTYRLRLEGQM